MSPLLEMRGITKKFPGVTALDAVDFKLEKGEVHVLLGENGAGKSTLIKMLSGAYSPDEGEILLDGEKVEISSSMEAQRLGIATIYQEFNLPNEIDVEVVLVTQENISDFMSGDTGGDTTGGTTGG